MELGNASDSINPEMQSHTTDARIPADPLGNQLVTAVFSGISLLGG